MKQNNISPLGGAPLSPSTENAVKIAFARAIQRAGKGEPPIVSALDLLVGIFISHSANSEPLQLLQHAEISEQAFYEHLHTVDGGFDPSERSPKLPEGIDRSVLQMDEDVLQISSMADKLASEFIPAKEKSPYIRLRHLFGALLLTKNAAAQLFENALANTAVSLDAIKDQYTGFLAPEWSKRDYQSFLAEHHRIVNFALIGYDADTRAERDLVGVSSEVNAMAYLIAAKSLVPPLAIGLFGDWGSGKTFFMDALKKRIHAITKDARDSKKPQKELDIYKHIVQIEFNAWHYVEGELWASLVEHIFNNLRIEEEPTAGLLEERQKQWIDKIESTRRIQEEKKREAEKLKKELGKKQKEIKKLESAWMKKREELNQLTAQDVLSALKLDVKDNKEIVTKLESVGLTAVGQQAWELMDSLGGLRAQLQRSNAITAPFLISGNQSARWVIGLIVVLAAGPLVSYGLSMVQNIPDFTNVMSSLAAGLAGLTTYVKKGSNWLAQATTQVEEAKQLLEARRRDAEKQNKEKILEARRNYEEDRQKFKNAREEEQEISDQLSQLEAELKKITPGRVLLDFINERVGSDDYRKHLGVAALIRRDFEQLSGLIKKQNGAIEKGTEPAAGEHPINRIVLYIDDLDRCPPERVVDVLQAVHLLLAFPIFVVVVAVDARWLAQSLKKHYKELMTGANNELEEDGLRHATPHDYLEKIFQIPFWVGSLPEAARKRIVQGLVEKSLVLKAGQSAGKGGGKASTAATPGSIVTWGSNEWERPIREGARTELHPQGLVIQQDELKFMEHLAPILGRSPRSVKRFVNVYRLIKGAAVSRGSEFVADKEDADFKLVLFLLTVVTGLPTISRKLFEGLVQSTGDNSYLRDMLPEMIGLKSGQDLDIRLLANGSEWTNLVGWLDTHDKNHWWHNPSVDAFSEWLPRVARYSYRIEVY